MERKYLEYFDGAFDSTVADKMKPENKPYVAYSKTEGIVYTVIPEEPTSAYQMIDLGLPSGLKWADRNVGAKTPQDNGLYFSWGNVDGHAVDENGNVTDGYSFDANTYATTSGGHYTDNMMGGGYATLDTEHDAATSNMGSDWRMPTGDETVELIENTDHYYIGEDGNIVAESELSNSKKLRSICFVKQGEEFDYNDHTNFIEIPFAGRRPLSLLDSEGLLGLVWTSSIYNCYSDSAGVLYFSSGGDLYGGTPELRYYGYSVRGVQP